MELSRPVEVLELEAQVHMLVRTRFLIDQLDPRSMLFSKFGLPPTQNPEPPMTTFVIHILHKLRADH